MNHACIPDAWLMGRCQMLAFERPELDERGRLQVAIAQWAEQSRLAAEFVAQQEEESHASE